MSGTHIQDILPLVEAPSRYIGGETNAVVKDPRAVSLKMALAFPDLYEIGTSHFGLQILYHILNQRPDILAERVFTPAPDFEDYLRKRRLPLQTLESGRPLAEFDILGFSLLYELNYTNVIAMLDLSGLPFRSRERGRCHPFVIAGGPCTCNPEPIADFFDAIVVGEAEEVILPMADAWIEWQKHGGRNREALLEAWAQITGIYIPAFFGVQYDGNGRQRVNPLLPGYSGVEKAVLPELDRAPFPTAPVVPFGRPVHDRLRLELARGCTRGCRFCQAGMIYRPVRERAPETVVRQCEEALKHTGYDDISLLSLSTGDYSGIAPLMENLIHRHACDQVALSLPSLRAGTLTPELMQYIKTVRKTGFTIAPEAGSQRLRDLINKNISDLDIRRTVEDAFALGWNVVKLYFMIGLPSETQEDLESLVRLVRELSDIKGLGGKKGTLNVSVATMIPKPHTPFQWAPQISVAEGRQKIEWLQDQLRSARIRLKWQNPEVSLVEGLLARGDRRMADLIVEAYRRGCRLDGWSDHFRYDMWEDALRAVNLDTASFVHRQREREEVFPWDHIDVKVKRAFLWEEWLCALEGRLTEDCRSGVCQNCGVCNFTEIQPRLYPAEELSHPAPTAAQPNHSLFRTVQLTFTKTGIGRFWGHLEMVNIFMRAFRRAEIPIKFSEGFHPKPKIAFGDALPIGLESLCETMTLSISSEIRAEDLVARLNRKLPEGLTVTDCVAYRKVDPAVETAVVYRVSLKNGRFDPELLRRFDAVDNIPHERANRKGKLKKIDLKAMVRQMRSISSNTLELVIRQKQDASLRPDVLMSDFFKLPPEEIRQARTVKLRNLPANPDKPGPI